MLISLKLIELRLSRDIWIDASPCYVDFFEFYLANPAQKKPCKLPAPLFMFSHMGQIWCQFFCDFMKISRFENVLFVCLNFCVSLRITCKGVENESFQEFSIISQKLKACSTCSKNPADGPPPYPGSKRTVCVASFIFHMREHKERGAQPAPKCRVFQDFM